MAAMPREVSLTFDVEGPPGREDFMNSYVLGALHKVLKQLEKHNFRGLFFITGNVVEKVCNNPEIRRLLERHQIGFHSSSHSVTPRIFEYTDLPNYEDAVKISLRRETSKINPFSGKILGSGGILYLRECFPEKKIWSFRAPFDYISPPHLEALKKLGVKFIFSGDFCHEPVFFKGLTFYPTASFIDGVISKIMQIAHMPFEPVNRKPMILALHPCQLVFNNSGEKALNFHFKNLMHPFHLKPKNSLESTLDFCLFQSILSKLDKFRKMGLIHVTLELKESETPLKPERLGIGRNYIECLSTASRLFGYKPKFLLSHYNHFLHARV